MDHAENCAVDRFDELVTGAVQLVDVALRGGNHGIVRPIRASIVFAIPLRGVAAVECEERIHDRGQFRIELPAVVSSR